MNNFGHATEATATAMDSAGSAARENERYMEGLEAKTQALKSSFQQLAASVVDSGLVKGILDLANAFLKLLNTPLGTFVTQTALLTGLLWGGSGLIKAMSVIPAFFATAAKGATGLAAALSLTGPQFALIAAAIAGLILVMPKVVDWFKKWTDEVYAAESDLDDYNEKLDINRKRLEELEKIPVKNRTSEMREEIEALKNQNAELEKQIELRQKDLEIAKFQAQMAETHETGGQFVYTSPETSGTGDYGEVRDESGYELFVTDAQQALNRLVELGKLTESQVKDAMAQVNNDAALALQQLGYTLIEGYGEMTSREYYQGVFAQLEQVQNKMQAGEINADTINSYIELKDALDGLFDSASSVEDSGLPEWVLQLRDNFAELPDITDQVADSYYNFVDTLIDLSDGMEINSMQYDQLLEQFPQLSSVLEKTENGYIANASAMEEMLGQMTSTAKMGDYLSSVYQKLISGMGVSQQEIVALTNKYPGLISMIHEAKGSYYLEIQALADSANASASWANAMIGNEGAATREAIEAAEQRVKALEAELHARIESGMYGDMVELNAQLQRAHKHLEELQNMSYTPDYSGVGGGGISTTPGGGGGGSHTEKDPLAEQAKKFKEIIKLMEHELFLMEKMGSSDEARIDKIKAIKEEIEKQRNWFYSKGLDQNSKYIQELEKQWLEYDEKLKDLYREQAEVREMLFDAVADKAQSEIDVLEKEKEKIQEQNDELERKLKLEQALDALARAKQQKVLVYKDGRMQYVQDVDAVAKAQQAANDARREQDVNQRVEEIDKEIDRLQKIKDEWSSIVDDYKRDQDLLFIQEKLGIKLWEENWEEGLGKLKDFVTEYKELMDKANASSKLPEVDTENLPNKDEIIPQDDSGENKKPNEGGSGGNKKPGKGGSNENKNPGGSSSNNDESTFDPNNQDKVPSEIIIPVNGMNSKVVMAENANPAYMKNSGGGNPTSMMTGYDLSSIPANQTPGIIIENFNPSLPNVTDGEGFVNYLKNNFWGQTLQLVKA